MPEQIEQRLSRFYQGVNQIMIAHLYDKFKLELDKLCGWLLKFANRMPEWRKTKPYEFHKLASYEVGLSSTPLLTIEVTFEETRENILNSEDDQDEALKAG